METYQRLYKIKLNNGCYKFSAHLGWKEIASHMSVINDLLDKASLLFHTTLQKRNIIWIQSQKFIRAQVFLQTTGSNKWFTVHIYHSLSHQPAHNTAMISQGRHKADQGRGPRHAHWHTLEERKKKSTSVFNQSSRYTYANIIKLCNHSWIHKVDVIAYG